LPELEGLFLGDPPQAWAELGFSVGDGQIELGGVRLVLGDTGSGITAWTLDAVDGLQSRRLERAPGVPAAHPNGALGVDHVVVVTPAFERTRDRLATAGMPLRRVAEMRGTRMGFRRIGPAILEVVETPGAARAAFWGLVVIVADLDALALRLGERLGGVKPAVQPGRRIATVRADAGLSTNLAFMDPEPR
jgi:hypothetical protein